MVGSMHGLNGWSGLTTPQRWTLAAVIVVAIAVRSLGIGTDSFWIDEAASWGYTQPLRR